MKSKYYRGYMLLDCFFSDVRLAIMTLLILMGVFFATLMFSACGWYIHLCKNVRCE